MTDATTWWAAHCPHCGDIRTIRMLESGESPSAPPRIRDQAFCLSCREHFPLDERTLFAVKRPTQFRPDERSPTGFAE